mmetsp:Transcript_41618/g.90732  ORF Transcript_41618/g.90732 Transcript_41618/m.90732 type:complete len:139 (+) Transcript_41618:173-589(+)
MVRHLPGDQASVSIWSVVTKFSVRTGVGSPVLILDVLRKSLSLGLKMDRRADLGVAKLPLLLGVWVAIAASCVLPISRRARWASCPRLRRGDTKSLEPAGDPAPTAAPEPEAWAAAPKPLRRQGRTVRAGWGGLGALD